MTEDMATVFATSYGAVLLAEIVGDKLLYTTGVLATRFRTGLVLGGAGIACLCKMAVAVYVGSALSRVSPAWIAALTCANFLAVAFLFARTPSLSPATATARGIEAPRAVALSFLAVLFSEWGDVGQITAAAMAARFEAPVAVWLGAVAALMTKGVLGAAIGAPLRTWLRVRTAPRAMRLAGAAAIVLLGVFSAIEVMHRPA
jgi:putative Ca2+/H+ antiporter (TMEM165/GDT1 family)